MTDQKLFHRPIEERLHQTAEEQEQWLAVIEEIKTQNTNARERNQTSITRYLQTTATSTTQREPRPTQYKDRDNPEQQH